MRNKVITLADLEKKVLEAEAKIEARNKIITIDDSFRLTIIKKSMIIL